MGGSGAVEKRKKLAPGMNTICEIDPQTISKYWGHNDSFGYHIEEKCFIEWYRNRKFLHGTTLIYADPPYLLSSRASGKEYYRHEWDDEMHERFLTFMCSSRDLVAISHYKCSLYDKYLKDWRLIEWPVMTHAGPRKEALYMNYSEPAELHQYDFLGKNFTDRQRLKRMKQNMICKLDRLPDQSRYMILEAVQEYIRIHRTKKL